MTFARCVRENRAQAGQLLIQVLLVGFAIGMTRTVFPALAESDFGLARGSVLLLVSFVLVFGLGAMGLALGLSALFLRDTLPWARAESAADPDSSKARSMQEVFSIVSWRDKRLMALPPI